MATGDHPATAAALGARVGIAKSHVVTGRQLDDIAKLDGTLTANWVFARVTPSTSTASSKPSKPPVMWWR